MSVTTTAAYAYDAFNRRIAKTLDSEVTAFVYDASNRYSLPHDDILFEFAGPIAASPVLERRWLHGNRVDEPLAFEDYSASLNSPGDGTVYAVYADRLGSISSVVDTSTGSVAAEYDYDAFGQRVQFAGTLFQHYGYTAREEDPESDLVYYRARHFDPAIGQFLQRDPIGFAAGDLNLYAYVGNDPYNWTDPTGLLQAGTYKNQAQRSAVTAVGVVGIIAGCASTEDCRSGALGLAAAISDILMMAGDGLNDKPDDGPAPGPGGPNQCGPEGGGGGPSIGERLKAALLNFMQVIGVVTTL